MKRWKLYFAYAHLPPHLQAVSKPFCDLAVAIAETPGDIYASRDAHYDLVDALGKMSAHDADELWAAKDKLTESRRCVLHGTTEDALRALLEAKDAAVRAHIPDPPEGA